ncbi:MAG: hypothetical protein LOD89_08045, partial [Tissierellales bacterium]
DGASVKLADKMKALEFLAKYTDLLSENDRKRLQEEKLKIDIEKSKSEIEKIKDERISFNIVDSFSEVGGGSLPLERIPTKCIMISLTGFSINEFEKSLREYDIPIITRIHKDNVFIDLRTIREDEFHIIADGILYGLNRLKGCI